MGNVPDDLRRRLHAHGQDHVLAWWDQLADPERQGLLDQLQTLDLEQLGQLYAHRDQSFAVPPSESIRPPR